MVNVSVFERRKKRGKEIEEEKFIIFLFLLHQHPNQHQNLKQDQELRPNERIDTEFNVKFLHKIKVTKFTVTLQLC